MKFKKQIMTRMLRQLRGNSPIHKLNSAVELVIIICLLTFVEFKTWKHDEETRTVTGFNKRHGSANKSIEHYYCRRSGRFKSQSSQKRRMKMQGSCRAGSECPASITTIATPRGTCIITKISC